LQIELIAAIKNVAQYQIRRAGLLHAGSQLPPTTSVASRTTDGQSVLKTISKMDDQRPQWQANTLPHGIASQLVGYPGLAWPSPKEHAFMIISKDFNAMLPSSESHEIEPVFELDLAVRGVRRC
jgi:hypothetical protein